jgi:23S rRNA (cytosine1962-C5)-methyltransferase
VRRIKLTKTGFNKLKSNHHELKVIDLEDSIKSITPGEWCILIAGPTDPEGWVAHINPLINEKFACVQVLTKLNKSLFDEFSSEQFVREKIRIAFEKRKRFKGYEQGSRLFYGSSDGLSGLIIDLYQNASIVQINSAGVDKHRDLIKRTVHELTDVPSFFLDNPKYREKEFLPDFGEEALPDLRIVENAIRFELPREVIQKVGFYYDHRENRNYLQNLLARMTQLPTRGIDLFCYAGAWGFNALAAGVDHVEFVDQGDFNSTIDDGLKVNGFNKKGVFHRHDVFKYLDQKIDAGKKYDLILCDPPAFAKSASQKLSALEGYTKLHRKVFKVADSGAICVFSSCTHYVSHEEFQRNIFEAASRENKKIQLLFCGIQGWDHPIGSLDDRSNYIKSYFYILE